MGPPSFRSLAAFVLLAGLCIFLLFHPGKFASRYHYLPQSQLWSKLVRNPSSKTPPSSVAPCEYEAVIADYSPAETPDEEYLLDASRVTPGGEYSPSRCAPLFSTAVVVPYKDRHRQLKRFLNHMHLFLRKQNLHYRIYVVEQDDDRPFNRAKLLNVGAAAAIRHGFPCLVLHDVDLLPLTTNNVYACTRSPRHMSSSIDKFRYRLPYDTLFGGAVAVLSDQFIAANGMSNRYFGWGAEDDDLYRRLEEIGLTPCRLEPAVSAYMMMKHERQPVSPVKDDLLEMAHMRYTTDGLNSLEYKEKFTKLHALFTHIAVEL